MYTMPRTTQAVPGELGARDDAAVGNTQPPTMVTGVRNRVAYAVHQFQRCLHTPSASVCRRVWHD